MAELFISYARGDDERFVSQLYHDLIEQGIDVWWDRETMASRGRTFLQEIRDAIAHVDRVLLVLGPQAVKSEYVRAEWEFALTTCTVVLPILRLGDYTIVPDELSTLHCPDFRTPLPYNLALKELLRLLIDPVPPLGTLYGVHQLPPHYLPRPEAVDEIKQRILTDTITPTVITSTRQTTALRRSLYRCLGRPLPAVNYHTEW